MKVALAVLIGLLVLSAPAFYAVDTLPNQLSDAEFWKMVEDFSEPNGFFPYENFVSNEIGYQTVIPELKRTVQPGGVYLGVAPEQNFTYVAALQPKIAFIIDIRRQNMLEHLMYKALFEMCPTRADFISRLFSRPRPADLTDSNSLSQMFTTYNSIQPSGVLHDQTIQSIKDILKQHKFGLSAEDVNRIAYIFNVFYRGGPRMDYTFSSATPNARVPRYVDLMLANDERGTNWNYLATKAAYDRVRDMEKRNVIVPLVGDFGGPKTLRSISNYLKQHGAVVSVFYLSNVETYVQQERTKWTTYLENLAALPADSNSMFIRWVSSSGFTLLERMKPR